MPLACIVIAAIVLFAFPKGVYRPPGTSALLGFRRYVAHASLAGAPAAFWAWTDPRAPLEGLIGLVVLGIGVSTAILVTALIERKAAPRPAAQAPAAPEPAAPIDPFALAQAGR